jgi:hypothetical protein
MNIMFGKKSHLLREQKYYASETYLIYSENKIIASEKIECKKQNK